MCPTLRFSSACLTFCWNPFFFSESLAFAEFLPEDDESTRPQELIIPRWFWTLDLSKSTCDAIIQTWHFDLTILCCVSIMFHSKKSPVEIMVSLATWCEINWLCHIHQWLLWPTIWYTKYILCYTNYFYINTMSELNTSSSSYLDPPILRNWLVTKVDRSNQCSLGICDLILMRNAPLLFFLHSSFTGNVDRHRIFF